MKTTQTATEKKRAQWPRVRKIEARNKPWLVDARVNGAGERFFFETALEADTKAEILRTARQNEGTAAVSIPEELRVEAVKCHERLAKINATLTEATDYFFRHARPEAGAITVTELVNRFIAAKTTAGRRPEYLRIQGHVLGNFSRGFPAREVHTITSFEISEWMDAQGWKLRTRDNYRADISKLFRFAMKHGHCAADPAAKIERATLDESEPSILTVTEATKLLQAAANEEAGALVPYVAIGLFAGLRTRELLALEWKEVSTKRKTITVLSHKAKGRARRVVTMSDNLAAWLKFHAHQEGRIVPTEGFRGMWRRVRKAAGGEWDRKWDRNCLRHTFASMHVAAHQNAPKTSVEMGHDNPDQLFQSYRALVHDPRDARRFWKIEPRKK